MEVIKAFMKTKKKKKKGRKQINVIYKMMKTDKCNIQDDEGLDE